MIIAQLTYRSAQKKFSRAHRAQRKFRVEPERNVRRRFCSQVTFSFRLPCFYGSGHSFAKIFIRCTVYQLLALVFCQPSSLSLGRQGELPVGQEKAPWGGWHRAAMTERGYSKIRHIHNPNPSQSPYWRQLSQGEPFSSYSIHTHKHKKNRPTAVL